MTGRIRVPPESDDPSENQYGNIVLLHAEFNGDFYTGTASIIACGTCLLTCAHNIVASDRTGKKFKYATKVWFDIRNNCPKKGYTNIARYHVRNLILHPSYFDKPTPLSGNDLALCFINVPENDSTLNVFPLPIRQLESFCCRLP